ncbi:MAG: hypothetical protein D6737_06885 [Chloroflexi bacterium]|nr:MAG: hypothetical protein D6737_06885 [Chloroflexota bacterium]
MVAGQGRFIINFGEGRSAFAINVPQNGDALATLEALGFKQPMPALIIMGGAMDMEERDRLATGSIFEIGLAKFAEQNQIAIVDGGTDSGVMKMIGMARRELRYHFPLVGVVPHRAIAYPGYNNPGSMANLDSGHSHFVLVDGNEFGDESTMMAHIAHALTGYGQKPVVGLIINGGPITRVEVHQLSTSPGLKMPLLVLAGSGRFADELVEAIQTGNANGEQDLAEIIEQGDVHIVSLKAGPEGLRDKLKDYFNVT